MPHNKNRVEPQAPAPQAEPETYLGGDPETEERREVAALADERRRLDQLCSRLERQEAELQAQREEHNEFVRKMLAQTDSAEMAAERTQEADMSRLNNAVLKGMRERGTQSVLIMIPPDDRDPEPVYVSVNGNAKVIRRGVPTEIGLEYLEALQNALQDGMEHEALPNGHSRERRVQRQTVPFTVLDSIGARTVSERQPSV